MKKFLYCVLLFAAASFVCLAGGYALTRYSIRQEEGTPNSLIETHTVDSMENLAAAGQEEIRPVLETEARKEFYLVSEAGFLLVFSSDQSTICLYTHIPVTDFPEEEQARLMEGIWFPTMMDVYHYLESYTS